MSNLTLRVLVAIVGIPVILLLCMAGGFPFFWGVSLASTLALLEFYKLAKTKGVAPQVMLGVVFGFCVNAVFVFDRLKNVILSSSDSPGLSTALPSMPHVLLIVMLVFVPLVLVVELFRNRGSVFANIGATILGVLYVSFFLGSLIGLRELFVPGDFPVYRYFDVVGANVPAEVVEKIHRWGGLTVATVFASIWLCDTAAYFIGIGIGKHKLFERVSPNKTWEGAVAGFVAAVLTFVAARGFLLEYMSVTTSIVCGVIVGLFGQMGDLVESLFKRDAGVKDSSSFIPGHGGVLDRFDSLTFVSPLLYLYLDLVVF